MTAIAPYRKTGVAYKKLRPEEKELLKQNCGACELCDKTEGLVIDHDHETGMVRGVLCGPCNLRIGWIEAMNLAWIERASSYLGDNFREGRIMQIIQKRYNELNQEWLNELKEVEQQRDALWKQIRNSENRISEIQIHLKGRA